MTRALRRLVPSLGVALALLAGARCGSDAPPAPPADPVAEARALLETPPSDDGARVRGLARLEELLRSGLLAEGMRRAVEAIGGDPHTVERRLAKVDTAVDMVAAQLCLRGLLAPCRGRAYESWEEIARRHGALLGASAVARGERDVASGPYLREIEQSSGAAFVGGTTVVPLVDGRASWGERRRLIAGAKETLHVMSWAIYDDGTGWEAVRAFADRAREGVQVRVMVDEQVAAWKGYGEAVRWLREEAARASLPVEVVTWRDPERPYDGLHRKLLIADGREAVCGGMNFGDLYSHADPARPGWRDTDVLVRGSAVGQASTIFAREWNAQRETRGLPVGRIAPPPPPQASAEATARVAFVDQSPGGGEEVLLAILKAVDGARATIDVENAYYVRIPSVEAALLAAIRRGVRVRLLTNSPESLDEPILGYAILVSAGALADAGAEVHLRRGTTLHSKFLVVDGRFSQVGSFNLHPRSNRLEGEVVVNVLDETFAKSLTAAFERDLREATRLRSSSDRPLPTDPLGRIGWAWFPDLL